MKDILPWPDAAPVLADLVGVNAQIWQFSVSLVRVAIRLYRHHQKENLFLLGVGCSRISGPFRWDDAHIEVVEAEDANDSGHTMKVIRDLRAGFELHCSDVFLVRSTMADFNIDWRHRSDDGTAEAE